MIIFIILLICLSPVIIIATRAIYQRDTLQQKLNYVRRENNIIQEIIYAKGISNEQKVDSIKFEFENLPF